MDGPVGLAGDGAIVSRTGCDNGQVSWLICVWQAGS